MGALTVPRRQSLAPGAVRICSSAPPSSSPSDGCGAVGGGVGALCGWLAAVRIPRLAENGGS